MFSPPEILPVLWQQSADVQLPRISLAGTQVLGHVGSRPSLQQVGRKTTLGDTNATLSL